MVESFRESYFPYIGAEIKDYFEKLKAMVDPDLCCRITSTTSIRIIELSPS